MPAPRSILRVHLHGIGPGDRHLYEMALTLLGDVTPLVQALPPDAADLDVTGAHRYFDAEAGRSDLAHLVRLRLAAHAGLRATIGAGCTPMIAAMAAAATAPGDVTVIAPEPEAVAAFLGPRPVADLPGVGPATAGTLAGYGIHRIGDLLRVPPHTLRRILGRAAALTLSERARGHDPRPVRPAAPPTSTGCAHGFPHDELDPRAHRRALLDLVERLGLRLRTTRQVATRLALSVTYADGTSTHRSRTLDEPTAHTPALAACAYDLHARLGLQRARVRAVAVRAEQLMDEEHAVRQLVLDPGDDRRRRIEQAADRARARFGADAVRPATLARPR
ncbi:DNA polymerase thumb domain-containing protein [Streptosporangium longisporum]|uniref:UmuC domain-containing protein n=1 Tax=Streptosporangium longisporum TaxID=46187 RepID=A0ABN3Y3W0_9ACTN